MATRKLYYEDVYAKEFQARVTAWGQDEKGFYVVLDQTLFYPEGGGQPADQGILGGARVVDVQNEEGELKHYLDQVMELWRGREIAGVIDWERRFDLMQQHSGEHIVSGMVHNKYGYENVGFHMGEDMITIDFSGRFDQTQMEELEAEVNAYIWAGHQAHVFFASEKEKKELPYRSKKEIKEEVRLVEFPGADLCACCGLHVAQTGEIGLVKLISCRKFREGVRVEMLSGKRAFSYMNTHCVQNSRIAAALSVKPENTFRAVNKEQDEVFRLRGKIIEMEKEKYQMIARQCAGRGNILLFLENMDAAALPKCADIVLEVCGGICVLFSGDDEKGYKYAVGERGGDVRPLVKRMNETFQGRGGGKPFFAQGSLKGTREALERFFEEPGPEKTMFTKL